MSMLRPKTPTREQIAFRLAYNFLNERNEALAEASDPEEFWADTAEIYISVCASVDSESLAVALCATCFKELEQQSRQRWPYYGSTLSEAGDV